ncbi:MAG: S1 RNA-binding domain-containing protein [Planctomycetota bacterium]
MSAAADAPREPSSQDLSDIDKEVEAALGEQSVFDLAGATEGEIEGADPSDERARVGRIVDIGKEDVIVEFGPREQGIVPLAHFSQRPNKGVLMRFIVERFDDENDLYVLSLKKQVQKSTWDELEVGQVINATVVGHNKGGLELTACNQRAFMPFSQIALERVDDPTPLLNQTFPCEVVELDKPKKRLVLSRRIVLERERGEALKKSVETLQAGSVLKGKVTRIEDFGAFVDVVNGIEGLVHISNLSLSRVEKVDEVVKVGDIVEVKVLKIEKGGKRISLGMKQLAPDPWEGLGQKYSPEQAYKGKVTRTADFGAFVELEPGIEGLVHISQLSDQRVSSTTSVVQSGQEVTVRVLSIDPDKRRISLTMRTDAGEQAAASDEADRDTVREYKNPSRGKASQSLGDLLRRAMDDSN